MVVLGYQLNADGTMRDELLERLRVAKASAEKYPNAYIVCTGGPTAYEDKTVTEAGRMAELGDKFDRCPVCSARGEYEADGPDRPGAEEYEETEP